MPDCVRTVHIKKKKNYPFVIFARDECTSCLAMKYKKAKRDTLNNVNLIYSVEGRYGNYYTQHLWAALHFTQKPLPSHSKLQLTLRFYNTISNDKENVAL